MFTIHKFPLEFSHNTNIAEVELPEGYKVVDVGSQGANLFVWALIKDPHLSPQTPKIKVKFRIYGTGWPVDVKHKLDFDVCFIRTIHAIVAGSCYVWHIFYEDK
jgi:hypothetical protein